MHAACTSVRGDQHFDLMTRGACAARDEGELTQVKSRLLLAPRLKK
jgi:hypothetical protein